MRAASCDFVSARRLRLFGRGLWTVVASLGLLAGAGAPFLPASALAAAAGVRPVEGASAPWLESLQSIDLPRGTRLVEAPAGSDPGGAERALAASGFEVAVSVTSGLFVVRATPRARALPEGFASRVEGVAPLPGERGPGEGIPGAPERAVVPSTSPGVTTADLFGGVSDLLPPPARVDFARAARRSMVGRAAEAPTPVAGLFYGTRWEDLSEFLVGRVGVGILFPESDGSVDPNLYDWTPALRDSVVRSAVRGYAAWSAFAAARGIALSFHLEIHPSLPTRYEPILRPVSQEELWIEEMLRAVVGYRGDAFTMAQEVANGVRGRLATQWGCLVIPVQNDSSSTGTFPDGLIAHARLGGPWYVIPVNNLRSTAASLDFYMQHEMAHVFWALDEFPANNAWWSCTLTTGYFERPNWNSDIPFPGYCEPHVDCFMRGNWPNALCRRTADQVGWVDSDGSGTIDFYETAPAVVPDSTRYRVVAGFPLDLRGRGAETALPNRNPYRYSGDSITVSTLDSILYRVDGGPWTSVPPKDGVFDEGEEPFDFTIPPLSIGTHLIEWQARNTNDRPATLVATTNVTVSGSAGSVDPPEASAALRLTLGPSPGRTIRFSVTGARAAGSTLRLWTPRGELAREWRLPATAGRVDQTWDGRLRNGAIAPSGVYVATLDSGGERVRRRLVYVR